MSFEEWIGSIDSGTDIYVYKRMDVAYQAGHAEGCKEQQEIIRLLRWEIEILKEGKNQDGITYDNLAALKGE